MADPKQFEYRWRSMAAFAHPKSPRVPRHFTRAMLQPPEPLVVAPGETIDHVVHHIMPGKPGMMGCRAKEWGFVRRDEELPIQKAPFPYSCRTPLAVKQFVNRSDKVQITGM